MKKIWFVSDLHLGHGNIIIYSKRPFMNKTEYEKYESGVKFRVSRETIDEMDNTILDNINNCVKEDDILYHLGDFCMPDKYSGKDAKYYRNRIKCKNIHNIYGNHDKPYISDLFSSNSYLREIEINGQLIILCHYAMVVWNKHHHGSIHLYGHSHSSLEETLDNFFPGRRAIDVGVDNIYKLTGEFRPISYDEILKIMSTKKGHFVDHHK